MGENSGLSASDVLALTRDGNNGFGGDWSWLIGLLVVAGIFGNGTFGGFGGGNGGRGGVGDNYILATDFATIERKLDSISNGICDSTFALNNTVVNGFNGVQNTLCQGFNGLNVAYLQGQNAISSQLADCCCKTQRGIDSINYNMATNTCAITNTMNINTRDIIDNQNANYRALHEEIVANRIEDLKEENRRLAERNNSLELRASQNAQTCEIKAYVQDQVNPKAYPSYIVPNPNCCYNYNVTGFGYGNSCGCGSY